MSKCNCCQFARSIQWLHSISAWVRHTIHYGHNAFRRLRPSIEVEVLVADCTRSRRLERDLRVGVDRLKHVFGVLFPTDLAVVVQQVITTHRQLAGCYQIGQRPDGTRFALIRLALQVDERPLGCDELLAVLAEQCISLAFQQCSGPSVLVPVEFELGPSSAPPSGVERVATPRPDPLVPHPNGTGTGQHRP